MALYVDLPTFRSLTVIPGPDVDMIEENNRGFIEARSGLHQEWVDAQLGKRYVVPFGAPAPRLVVMWIVTLLTLDAYQRRGFNASLAELQPMVDAAARAMAEVNDSADSQTGLFVLPAAIAGGDDSAVTRGGPQFYSETSPYVSLDLERVNASREDAMGRGT